MLFRNVYLKSLRDQRRGLVGWGIAIAALIGLMAGIWPSMRDMPNLEEFLANYPEEFGKLFNVEAMTTPAG